MCCSKPSVEKGGTPTVKRMMRTKTLLHWAKENGGDRSMLWTRVYMKAHELWPTLHRDTLKSYTNSVIMIMSGHPGATR